jgi:hypothetical protein
MEATELSTVKGSSMTSSTLLSHAAVDRSMS